MRRVFTFFLIIFFTLANVQIIDAGELKKGELYSLSAVLIDGDSGRVLFGKEETKERPMASTTKIMTLILALEYGNIDDIVTVSGYAEKMPDVKMRIKKGEQYYLKDMLLTMIMESYNDVAVCVAEHVGGSTKDFADMMNKKAKEIGMNSTYFITANGLDAEDEGGIHHTTAYDLALLMRYCVKRSPKKDEFISICQTRSHSFYDFSKKRLFSVTNKNRLLDMMDGVMAGKTGFTGNAGYCYTAAICVNDKVFIVALLGCGWPNNKSYKWSDAKKLFNYAKENYDIKCVLDENEVLNKVPVKNGIEADEIDVYMEDKIDALICENDKVTYKYNIPEFVIAPIFAGDIIGCVTVCVNSYPVGCANIYSGCTVNEKDYKYFLKTVFTKTLF